MAPFDVVVDGVGLVMTELRYIGRTPGVLELEEFSATATIARLESMQLAGGVGDGPLQFEIAPDVRAGHMLVEAPAGTPPELHPTYVSVTKV
jgi:hypothetical protein